MTIFVLSKETLWKSDLYIDVALKGISVVATFGEGFIDGMTAPVPQFLN